jgi:hypothetical protein
VKDYLGNFLEHDKENAKTFEMDRQGQVSKVSKPTFDTFDTAQPPHISKSQAVPESSPASPDPFEEQCKAAIADGFKLVTSETISRAEEKAADDWRRQRGIGGFCILCGMDFSGPDGEEVDILPGGHGRCAKKCKPLTTAQRRAA